MVFVYWPAQKSPGMGTRAKNKRRIMTSITVYSKESVLSIESYVKITFRDFLWLFVDDFATLGAGPIFRLLNYLIPGRHIYYFFIVAGLVYHPDAVSFSLWNPGMECINFDIHVSISSGSVVCLFGMDHPIVASLNIIYV